MKPGSVESKHPMNTGNYRIINICLLITVIIMAVLFNGCEEKNKTGAGSKTSEEKIQKRISPRGYEFQYRGDLANTGRYNVEGPAKGDHIVSFFSDGEIRGAAAVLHNGDIVFGNLAGSFYFLNSSGEQNIKKTLNSWCFSSPVVRGDKIIIGCDNGELVCMDERGRILWVNSFSAETSSSAAVYGDRIYMGAEDNALHCLTTDGKELWRFSVKKRILFSSPAVDNQGNIYIGAEDGFLYKVSPDGREIWSFDTGGEISEASPVLGDNGVIYMVSADGLIYCLNSEGNQRWVFKAHEEIFSNVALSRDGSLYCGAVDGVFLAVDSDGKLRWKKKIASRILSSPVIDSTGNVYVACDGDVIKMNPQGDEVFRVKVSDGIFKAEPVISRQGKLIVGDDKGRLFILGDKLIRNNCR